MSAKISIFLLAVLLAAPWAIGQSMFGGIVGVVKDPSQEAVESAHVTLTSLDDRTQRAASTDGNGEFEFINLKAGRYELVVHADGFADYKSRFVATRRAAEPSAGYTAQAGKRDANGGSHERRRAGDQYGKRHDWRHERF